MCCERSTISEVCSAPARPAAKVLMPISTIRPCSKTLTSGTSRRTATPRARAARLSAVQMLREVLQVGAVASGHPSADAH